MKVPLIALKDSRRLRVAKDALFLATRRDARVLKAVGLAADAPPMQVAMPKALRSRPVNPARPEEASMDARPALRRIYREQFGKAPFNGWDEATLREKIAAGGAAPTGEGRYQTRRLKAKD